MSQKGNILLYTLIFASALIFMVGFYYLYISKINKTITNSPSITTSFYSSSKSPSNPIPTLAENSNLDKLIDYQVPTGWNKKIILPKYAYEREHIILASPDTNSLAKNIPDGMRIDISKIESPDPNSVFEKSLHPTPLPIDYKPDGHENDYNSYKELIINNHQILSYFYSFEADRHHYDIIDKNNIWKVIFMPSEDTRPEYKTLMTDFLNSIKFK